MIKYSEDKKCRFYEKSHKYYVGRKLYKSVTTLIGEHFPKFDVKGVARMLASFGWAKKQHKGVRYWLSEWKKSAETGTLIHEEIEKLINNPQDYNVLKPVLHPRTIIAWEAIQPLIKDKLLKPEYLIYDMKYEIAGQIDLMITNTDGSITLVDWKATKSIDWSYKYNNDAEQFGITTETMHLQNCNGNKYTLQLSLYAYLLERKGYVIKDLIIGHIDPKKNSFVPIKVNYLKDTVENILNMEDLKNEEE